MVEKLKAPRAGTELMGPLLHSLLRSTRPEQVLEVGMGYTTPFILKALMQNKQDFIQEQVALKQKNRQYLDDIGQEQTDKLLPGSKPLVLMEKWASNDPPLLSPEYYIRPYEPRLHAIDNLSSTDSYSKDVEHVTAHMGTADYLSVYHADFRGLKDKILGDNEYLDFVWFDCGNAEDYKDFIDEYWSSIRPDGGLLLLHSTLNRYSYHSVMTYFKTIVGQSDTHDIEVLSLLEPHKLTQGSVTMIKKIKKEIPRFPVENAYSLLKSIRDFV